MKPNCASQTLPPPPPSTAEREETLRLALDYAQRGWSVIPCRFGEKEPACREWKCYQEKPADAAQLRKWLRGKPRNLAVVLGAVSAGLACRDFDDMAAYQRWAAAHSEWAAKLPTVATGQGRHVYFTAPPGQSGAFVKLKDGELRLKECYCLLPPSRHPEGAGYRWLIPCPDEVPTVDPDQAGLARNWDGEAAAENTPPRAVAPHATEDDRGRQRTTEEIDGEWDGGGMVVERTAELEELVGQAIADCLPQGPGQRHRQVFELARTLKGIPALRDADAGALKPAVKRWHDLALPVIRTKEFEESWIDFLQAWPKVKFAKGDEPMNAILERAKQADVPPEAQSILENPKEWLLVKICRELQRFWGDAPFFLSCRTAGKLLDVDYTTASRWLLLMRHERILKEVSKGAGGKASRYRYLLPCQRANGEPTADLCRL